MLHHEQGGTPVSMCDTAAFGGGTQMVLGAMRATIEEANRSLYPRVFLPLAVWSHERHDRDPAMQHLNISSTDTQSCRAPYSVVIDACRIHDRRV